MPKFKGITVTINPTYDRDSTGAFKEYGTITQKRANRITSYIASSSNTPFAVSIIMDDDYTPLTTLANESLAAYLYFDGRKQEETATLLRRGSETWISSRWVTMGNGELAEKEFYFKEIGLEVFLTNLDIKKDKRNGDRRRSLHGSEDDEDDEEGKEKAAAGQIRVDLYRVVPEGPVRKGEYKPMFTENDNEDLNDEEKNAADLEHTAGFGAPKPLFKEAISVQSVSHLDAESAPYASFIFFYRGERQLQKMGIMPKPKSRLSKTPATSTPSSPVKGTIDEATSPLSPTDRRKSGFKSFGDLQPGVGTPERGSSREKSPQKKSFGGFRGSGEADEDEEIDDDKEKEVGAGDEMEDEVRMGNGDEKVDKELAGEVKKITLKRAHESSENPESEYASQTRTPSPPPTTNSAPMSAPFATPKAKSTSKRYSVGGILPSGSKINTTPSNSQQDDESRFDSSAFSPAKRRRESRAIDFSKAAALGFGGRDDEVL